MGADFRGKDLFDSNSMKMGSPPWPFLHLRPYGANPRQFAAGFFNLVHLAVVGYNAPYYV
jgi:hypothetical protein